MAPILASRENAASPGVVGISADEPVVGCCRRILERPFRPAEIEPALAAFQVIGGPSQLRRAYRLIVVAASKMPVSLRAALAVAAPGSQRAAPKDLITHQHGRGYASHARSPHPHAAASRLLQLPLVLGLSRGHLLGKGVVGRFAMVALVVIIGTLAVGLVRPAVSLPVHPPDVHSGTPHRAAGSVSLADTATLLGAAPPGLGLSARGRVTTDSGIHPAHVELEPPEHPPR